MGKQKNERRVFDMAKQDVLFLKNLKLIAHSDRPDFVLEDSNGRRIGLEHFKADTFTKQNKNNSSFSSGNAIIENRINNLSKEYRNSMVNDVLDDVIAQNETKDLSNLIKDRINMQSQYRYEDFINNLHFVIHGMNGRKGHIAKSKQYPNRESFYKMGFLIEVPVPRFQYYFKVKHKEQFYMAYSYQRVRGLPITNEIWKELDVFNDVDFVIIETYESQNAEEHFGQYFDKTTQKPHIYPAFSFGHTGEVCDNVKIDFGNNITNITIDMQKNTLGYNIPISTTMLRAERRKQDRRSRKHFDKATRKFRSG